MSHDSTARALAALLRCARLEIAPKLAPILVPLPPRLHTLQGRLGKRAVTMHVQRRTGGAWASLLTADIRDDDDGSTLSATVIGLPDPGSTNPVLGVDLIALGGRMSLFAVDLAPVDQHWWNTRGQPALDALRDRLPASFTPRPFPDFAHETFSPRALIGRFEDADTVPALETTRQWLTELPQLLDPSAGASDPHRAARLSRWILAERRNRKEHAALSRIFGDEMATQLSHQVLFPDELIAS